MIRLKTAALLLALALPLAAPTGARAEAIASTTAQGWVDDLLATDGSFATAAAGLTTVDGLSAMFHDDVVMPLPDGTFARGKLAAVEALSANPLNLASRATWAPVRGGVSADGQHGFTLGYMTIVGDDGTRRLAKYLAYWLQTPQGWRVAAFKRMGRPEGEVSQQLMPPSLPVQPIAAQPGASAALAGYRQSLIAAEQAFSDEAQRIGLGPAFRRQGRADAVNLGSGAGFAVGPDDIARTVSDGSATSPVHWGADDALVAPSGDLGITFGFIRPNGPPPEGRPSAFPFFTIWRRDSPSDRWQYIAE